MAGQARTLLKGKDIPRDGVVVPIDIVPSAAEAALLYVSPNGGAEAPPLQSQIAGQILNRI
jgi:hypothetical protein